MNRRKNIYRGIDRRRKDKRQKIILLIICVLAIGIYGLNKIKDKDILSLLPSIGNDLGPKTYSYDDVSDELEKQEKDNKEDDSKEGNEEKDDKEDADKNANNDDVSESTEEIKLAMIEDWNIYTVQVASIEDDKEIDKIEKELNDKEIPFSIVEVDGLKKVQTHTYLKEEDSRKHLEDVKKHYPEAFISKLEIPLLSLEYTEKYSYIEDISNCLNDLISNFEEESSYLAKNENELNKDKYNEILDARSKIVDNIKKEAEEIDYESVNVFKENLIEYTNLLDENIKESKKHLDKKEFHICKGLFSSSMQGYYTFIDSIKSN